MTWLTRIVIGASIVLVLLIAFVLVAAYWSPDPGSVTQQTVSMTVGSRTVTIGGHLTQDSLTDGITVVVDGHEIVVGADQLTVDGKTQVLEPNQDVEVLVDKSGVLSVKLVASADAAQ